MKAVEKHRAVCVLTGHNIQRIIAEGGLQAWGLDAEEIKDCEYIVCIQNQNFLGALAPHHTAFLVGRLKEAVPPRKTGAENQWILLFSEYAMIDVPNAWPGYQNPVFYTDLESFGIASNLLKFQSTPERKNESN
jgi:hypothetical protein